MTIAGGSWYPANFGLGEERYAWIAATGDRVFEGSYETARLLHCRRTRTPEPCAVAEGPILPITGSSGAIQTHDRWIALTGCSEGDCDIYVFNVADDALYRIDRFDPQNEIELIGVTANELYAENGSGEFAGSGRFDGILRYDLERIDDFATRLQ